MYTLVTAQTPSYWVYAAGEQQIDDAGELKYTEETKVEYVQQDGFKEVERTIKLTSLYDAAQKTYTITLPMEAFDNAEKIKLKVSDDGSGAYSVKQAYVKQSYFTYLPLSQNDDSYVMYITLMRPAADQPWQDGNTRVDKVGVLQRPIQQKVKIVKDISINEAGKYEDNTFAGSGHEDGFTQNGGGTEDNAAYRPNFRFKIYLKSNLEQLYRDEEGKIDWKTIVSNFYPDLDEAVIQAEKDLEHVQIADEVTDEICELCGRNMVIKYGPHGKFLACPGFPECKNTKPYLERTGITCPKCGKEVVVRKTKKGRKYYGCEAAPDCDFMSWQKPSNINVKCVENICWKRATSWFVQTKTADTVRISQKTDECAKKSRN